MTPSDVTTEPAPHGGGKRDARASRRWLKTLGIGTAVLALLFAGSRLNLLPEIDDFFGEETHDRSGPAVLKSIQDMSAYEAASGNFQVVVDLEKDAKFVPDALRGTRTLFVGAGTVDASVDLGRLTEDGVVVNEDRTEAELRLPRAVLGKPALDPDRSYAVSKQRGLLDRLGDFFSDNPGSEQAVNKLAAQRIAEAARESELTARAEKNTAEMLKGLLGSLGFERVSVRFADDRR
ncbi:DUF4230 domain-containing protein [Streptomyces sp. V2I9]|uniref:DUF4230 domain-containing protein n=1 Tax=Streptomyces sp. V2I9 TaxID=3042304 RepID=UPI0027D8B25F|nr:DUF4230 domain-containing protein [Streptomyces sp. V2I9]